VTDEIIKENMRIPAPMTENEIEIETENILEIILEVDTFNFI